jgi:hypothetical protein
LAELLDRPSDRKRLDEENVVYTGDEGGDLL